MFGEVNKKPKYYILSTHNKVVFGVSFYSGIGVVVGGSAGSRGNPVRFGSGRGPLQYGTAPVRDRQFPGNPPGIPGGSLGDFPQLIDINYR